MRWTVRLHKNAEKQLQSTNNQDVLFVTRLLVNSLKENGPFPGKQWPNYGKLKTGKSEDKRHCHLIKGKPTYVCCWEVDKQKREIEVYYVGTHEKAPY